jgi:hydroxymethylpyrimidine pyrophosphatase-like HAD family hydrolase
MGHGHELLITYINKKDNLTNKIIIEIGSTREFIGYQNSSEEFIKFCKKNNMKFISVDMDPNCTKNVIKLAKKHNFTNYEAITMKGEDFLEKYNEVIDFIYLDAFDFAHNNHSKNRKKRYQEFLDCKITNKLCHEMHLQCCKNIINKMSNTGYIGFDDILNIKATKGKGVTAIPFLLNNNFKIIEFKDRSMILQKK